MKKLSYKTLYIAWAVMFVLTTALGFAFPEVENGWARFGLGLVAVLFFKLGFSGVRPPTFPLR